MRHSTKMIVAAAALALAACGSSPTERGLSGAAIGAGTGAAGAAIIGGNVLGGAALGGVAGGITGAATADENRRR